MQIDAREREELPMVSSWIRRSVDATYNHDQNEALLRPLSSIGISHGISKMVQLICSLA